MFTKRMAGIIVLIYGTYNPWGFSFFHWVTEYSGQMPLKVLSGTVLVIAFAILMQLTWRSIGLGGVLLTIGFCASLVWALVDYGVLDFHQESTVTNTINLCLAYLLNVGASWSHDRAALCGQIDVKNVNEY